MKKGFNMKASSGCVGRSLFQLALTLCIPMSGLLAVSPSRGADLEGYSGEAKDIVKQMTEAIRRLKSYEDESVVFRESDLGFIPREEQEIELLYAKPDRFRVKTQEGVLVSDGKKLTVGLKASRRYSEQKVGDHIGRQMAPFLSQGELDFNTAQLISSDSPKELFGRRFKDVESAADERIEGDTCITLKGTTLMSILGVNGQAPVSIFINKRTMLPRRVVVDVTELAREQMRRGPMQLPMEYFRYVYDVPKSRVDSDVNAEDFSYKPAGRERKVERLYASGRHTGVGAQPFELSGQDAPAWELIGSEGDYITCPNDKVSVLAFLNGGRWNPPEGVNFLEELHSEIDGDEVELIGVIPDTRRNNAVRDVIDANEYTFATAEDEGGITNRRYQANGGQSLVLIGKDGKVQGRYVGGLTSSIAEMVKTDIDRLVKGKTLDSGTPLDDQQLAEAADQRASTRRGWGGRGQSSTAEPLNEDWVKETWSIRASGGGGVNLPGSSPWGGPRGFWVSANNVIRRVSHSGEVLAEIRLPDDINIDSNEVEYTAGRFAGGYGVVVTMPVYGEQDEDEQGGGRFRGWGRGPRPTGALVIAFDERGDEMWSLEVEGRDRWMPRALTAADLDGRAGDETLFVYGNTLYILDARGEPSVRYPLTQSAAWMAVEDADADRKAEIYLRLQAKLVRMDYDPR
jgi:outer membrane lipoprotein-sorting protein